MCVRLIKSLQGRIAGIRNTWASRYWEYIKYYRDAQLWEDAILFESFGGSNFQGNPYYLYKEFLRNPDYSHFRLFIAHRDPEQITAWLRQRGLLDKRVTIVKKDSGEYRNVLAHSKYLVNNVSFTMDFIKKPGQVYLNTWHGTPLKCLGRNIRNDPFECNNAQRNFLLSDYLLAPNAFTKQVFEEDYMVHDIMRGQILLKGYPRNAVFFDEAARQAVKAQYHMQGVTTVLVMPTWRGTACGVDDVDQVSEIERLAKDLGEQYRVYVKFHPAMKKSGEGFRYCRNMPAGLEVYEFLNAVDILITDYSSVFFDFVNAGKKTVLYQYDRETYYASRGVYNEVAEDVPFPVAYGYHELLAMVKAVEQQTFPEFRKKYCTYDSPDASQEMAKLLVRGNDADGGNTGVDLYVIDFPVTDEQILRMKEKLDGTSYRFVFTLKRKVKHFTSVHNWANLDYLVLYAFDRLTLPEKIQYHFCSGIEACFGAKWARKVLRHYAAREQRRLWGEMKINHVYAKSSSLPTALKSFAEAWPRELE